MHSPRGTRPARGRHGRLAAACLLLCTAPAAIAATSLWWDTGYRYRQNVVVTTGAVSPDKGYAGYTARLASFDSQALIAAGRMRADCADLRVLYFDGAAWSDLPRDILGCNTSGTDLRFALQADIAASAADDNYYVYYGNPAAGAPAAVSPTNVYLWFDDASIDRSGSYVRGRIDAWHGSGWDNSLVWNGGGFYAYDNGDNFTSGYRRTVDERDVYIEAEFFHTDCYPVNMTTGLLVRGIIQSGSGGSESASHYYASNRGEFPQSGCNNAAGYTHDADILEGARTTTVVDGPNPGDVVASQWRRQGLAAFSINPTQLRFFDEDNSALWSALGFPAGANLQLSGSDGSDQEGRGFAAIMTAQDQARLRNVLIRRYVEPEPVLTTLPEEVLSPDLVLQKTSAIVSDPVNVAVNPKRIPGAIVEYTLAATNSGSGSPDTNTLVLLDSIPVNTHMCVGAPCMAGPAPVQFVDGSPSSGLNFVYARDVAYSSNNGVDGYTYVPVPDAGGFDANVTDLRINPLGAFAAPSGGGDPSFSVTFRVRVAN